jgi:hypothetical protein
MRSGFIVFSLAGLVLLILACSGNVKVDPPARIGPDTPRESLFVKVIELQEEAAALLTTVVDQSSLARAKPKLTALVAKHDGYKVDMQKMGPATLQESSEIRRKFGDRAKLAAGNLAREMTRVNSTIPSGGEVYRQMVGLWHGL